MYGIVDETKHIYLSNKTQFSFQAPKASCSVIAQFHNLTGQGALEKHIEVLTFLFPRLYGFHSRFQQLRVKR